MTTELTVTDPAPVSDRLAEIETLASQYRATMASIETLETHKKNLRQRLTDLGAAEYAETGSKNIMPGLGLTVSLTPRYDEGAVFSELMKSPFKYSDLFTIDPVKVKSLIGLFLTNDQLKEALTLDKKAFDAAARDDHRDGKPMIPGVVMTESANIRVVDDNLTVPLAAFPAVFFTEPIQETEPGE